MLKRTLAEVDEFAIIIEEKLTMKWKNMVRYRQNVSNSDESNDFDNEDEHHEKKTKKKYKKVDFEKIKKGMYCQICFYEGHFTKECKLLMKFYKIWKTSDHNTYQCPSKAMEYSRSGRQTTRNVYGCSFGFGACQINYSA